MCGFNVAAVKRCGLDRGALGGAGREGAGHGLAENTCVPASFSSTLLATMPRDGAQTLSDVRVPVLSIVCEPCGRCERYDVERLTRQYGWDAKLTDLLPALVADCLRGARSVSMTGARRRSGGGDDRVVQGRTMGPLRAVGWEDLRWPFGPTRCALGGWRVPGRGQTFARPSPPGDLGARCRSKTSQVFAVGNRLFTSITCGSGRYLGRSCTWKRSWRSRRNRARLGTDYRPKHHVPFLFLSRRGTVRYGPTCNVWLNAHAHH
jgi:hypothetical protein